MNAAGLPPTPGNNRHPRRPASARPATSSGRTDAATRQGRPYTPTPPSPRTTAAHHHSRPCPTSSPPHRHSRESGNPHHHCPPPTPPHYTPRHSLPLPHFPTTANPAPPQLRIDNCQFRRQAVRASSSWPRCGRRRGAAGAWGRWAKPNRRRARSTSDSTLLV